MKFTPSNGRVQVVSQRINSHIEITVNDTGTGIEPELLPFVFERFRQGDSGPNRRTMGLGLGLAIARHLIELHGGSVHAQSDGLGKGTTFIVRLPVMIALSPRVQRSAFTLVWTRFYHSILELPLQMLRSW